MKTEKLAKYILRLALTLLLITGAVAAALAGVNAITKDAIAANQEKKTQEALTVVLPEAGNLQKVELTGDTGIVGEVYTDGASYAVKVLPGGFDGGITMMVGIVDGKVSGISVISHTETPGLGAVAAAQNAKGEAFRGQFVGQEGKVTGISVISHTETPGLGAVAAAQNAKGEAFRGQFVGQEGTLAVGDQIDAMSGATITSNAVVTGVNAALDYVANMG